ncbi:hypothetical protein [Pedosphaera parvula]|uniref:Uncharacterized protein n=1 Tax=Pedosphaera parvula (strain Ellin514) TaxID=320771 RepID=B9XNY1_PEDPL|nr:hypothetical protein [Pedosphaera parvula]EEF58447.1 hypothetical protein Cflav_PD1070 [Pedosphaera parvula Ellin514]
MKKLLTTLLLVSAAVWTQVAGAFTYSDGDLLLVFRQDGFNDVEFNLGSVTNYLGKPSGTVLTVTNWDLAATRANFINNLSGVKFILMSATNSGAVVKKVYLTDQEASSSPTDISVSTWQLLREKIAQVGQQAAVGTATNSTQKYIISPSDTTAYTYIASEGGGGDVPTITGLAPFTVENPIPGTSRFFEVKGINPAVNASVQVGSFTMGTNGVLTFTAGVTQQQPPLVIPAILGASRIGNITSISFASTNGVNYRLRYTDSAGLSLGASNWTTLPSVLGAGPTTTLQDTAAVPDRFYKIEAYY